MERMSMVTAVARVLDGAPTDDWAQAAREACMRLAERIDSPGCSPSELATLCRELRMTLRELLRPQADADGWDELIGDLEAGE
jgi:hypothetical protein